ncbi:MAG: AAA family ATPase [Phascolarctobacterium faecium]
MYISRLCLQNYRCYDNFEIDFNKELTVIVAENGKGKTAILDAVAVALGPYLACFDGVKANQISDTDVRQTRYCRQDFGACAADEKPVSRCDRGRRRC